MGVYSTVYSLAIVGEIPWNLFWLTGKLNITKKNWFLKMVYKLKYLNNVHRLSFLQVVTLVGYVKNIKLLFI